MTTVKHARGTQADLDAILDHYHDAVLDHIYLEYFNYQSPTHFRGLPYREPTEAEKAEIAWGDAYASALAGS